MNPNPNGYVPLLAQRMRGLAVAVIVLAIVVTAVLGMRYADQDMAGHLDRNLDDLIRSLVPTDQPVTWTLVSLGNPVPATFLVIAVGGIAVAARRWSGALLAVIGTVTSITITEAILKPLVGRLRYGHLSFPSGHTTAVAAVAVAAAILIGGAEWPRSIALRMLASFAVIAISMGVAISLVAHGIHYTTDTVAGYCVALATVLSSALCLDYLGPRIRGHTRHAASAPSGTAASPDGGPDGGSTRAGPPSVRGAGGAP